MTTRPKPPAWLRPVEQAAGLPLMLASEAFEGVDVALALKMIADGEVTVYSAGDALMASRPSIEMAMELRRRAARETRSATYGKAGRDAVA